MDQALDLVWRSLHGQLDATTGFPGFVPPETFKLLLVLFHYRDTSQVGYFHFILVYHSQAFKGHMPDGWPY